MFSNWADLGCPIYRHIETGVRIPYKPPKPRPVKTDAMIRVEDNLGAYFIDDGIIEEKEFKDNLRAVFSNVPAHGKMFVLVALDTVLKEGKVKKIGKRLIQNAWTREAAAEFPAVVILDMADFIENLEEVKVGSGAGHFDRMVYFRVYQRIAQLIGATAEEQAA